MNIFKVIILLALLTGCTPVMVRAPDGTEMPADVYAHVVTVNAYAAQNQSAEACFASATTEMGLAVCALGNQRGQQAPTPQYQRAPSGFEKFVGTVQALSPLLSAGIQAYVSDRANERNTELQLGLSAINANREASVVSSIAGMNAVGYTVLGQTSASGYQALSQTSQAGYQAIENTAVEGFRSIETISEGFETGLIVLANQPPTYQLGDGSMIVTGNDNTSQTGSGQIDQSAVGGDRDVVRSVNCTSTASSSASGSSSGAANGTTGPFAQGGALGFYPQAPATNDCNG